MAPPPVRIQTVHTFLRERTGLRVGQDNGAAQLAEILTTISEVVADRAAELVQAEGESTIQAEHIETAFNDFLARRGPGLLAPEGLHTALSEIDNDGFASVIRLLRADLEDHP